MSSGGGIVVVGGVDGVGRCGSSNDGNEPRRRRRRRRRRHCILFYKYHPLTDDRAVLESYRSATESLCSSLGLTGRILLGLSNDGEGINGTLAGSRADLEAYVDCMLGGDGGGGGGGKVVASASSTDDDGDVDDDDDLERRGRRRRRGDSVLAFRDASMRFFERLGAPELILDGPSDFKWSALPSSSSSTPGGGGRATTEGGRVVVVGGGGWDDDDDDDNDNDDNDDDDDDYGGGEDEDCFPDLNVKIVREIVSSGGAFANITARDTSEGYLTPREWHEEVRALMEKKECGRKKTKREGGGGDDETDETDETDDYVDTVLIDVRNHKECQIGSFAPGISIDPNTKTFAQFPKWVKENSISTMENKRILMYCTGGIRCEKASAYVRKMVPKNKGIYHLKGGIHKYLEEFGRGVGATSRRPGVEEDDDGGGEGGGGGGGGVDDARSSDDDRRDECLFVGKNFVFDRRGALDAAGHGIGGHGAPPPRAHDDGFAPPPLSSSPRLGDDGVVDAAAAAVVVGRCIYCRDPHDVFRPECICTVCREPVLACDGCRYDLRREQGTLRGLLAPSSNGDGDRGEGVATAADGEKISCMAEYHCEDHFHLNKCYFTCLRGFSAAECNEQLERLRLHSVELERIGRKGKQKRRTLRRQMEKIEAYVRQTLSSDAGDNASSEPSMQCRHCGSSTCASNCWGFHGGNTRMVNKSRENHCGDGLLEGGANAHDEVDFERLRRPRNRVPSNQRPGKRLKRQNDTSEIEALQLCGPPSRHRNDATGFRVPPPVVRILKSGVKGRWCGKTISWVLKNEFGECLRGLTRDESDENSERVIVAGLVRVNGVPAKSSDVVLRNMDTLERIIHWHEPPIIVPPKISLTKHTLPENILPCDFKATGIPMLYCINKPPSVPVYPAGPYYANSLLLMVEAQEGLRPKTLIPLHRIDRATSGLLLCADASSVAGVIQGRMSTNSKDDENDPPVRKLYLARVEGKFPATSIECPPVPEELTGITSVEWCGDDANVLEVNAPIAVQLESNDNSGKEDEDQVNFMMHRTVRSDGKHSTSRFKLISYDETTNQSLVSCAPITGRGHQLRVHLQVIGFPIHNDVEYGGTVNVDSLNDQKKLSAQSVLEVSVATSECRHEQAVTSDEVESALQFCNCCIGGLDGIGESFNAAQLLGGGHAIDLHAYKYCLSFQGKGQKKRKQIDTGDCRCDETGIMDGSTMMEMSTDLPSWATSFVDLMPNTLTWLN